MNIQITGLPIKSLDHIEGYENGIDVQQHVNDYPYMYHGESKEHVLQSKYESINNVLDWFEMRSELESVKDL